MARGGSDIAVCGVGVRGRVVVDVLVDVAMEW